MGMRGKKDVEEEENYDLPIPSLIHNNNPYAKRAAFMGMRGRRSNANWLKNGGSMAGLPAAAFWPYSAAAIPKMRRGGNAGFVGMRG